MTVRNGDSVTVDSIHTWYENDEFRPVVVTGNHGYGKSSFAMQVCSMVYSLDGKTPNYEAVKKHIVFHPKDFLERAMEEGKKREPLLIWDDAGYWLNSLDYQNPFVKAVGKYLQVVRSDYGCIMFTCIDEWDVMKKVRGIPNVISVKIVKDGDKQHPYQRIARGYRGWKSPDGSRYGKTGIYEDNFNCRIRNKAWDDFYVGWYKPMRDDYAHQAKEYMTKHLNKLEF